MRNTRLTRSGAQKYMEPVRKALKKRDNKKLDYERYYKEVEHLKKKRARTDRSV